MHTYTHTCINLNINSYIHTATVLSYWVYHAYIHTYIIIFTYQGSRADAAEVWIIEWFEFLRQDARNRVRP